MMAVLGAAVAVVGLLCIADLLLTFGVIRRLRQHNEMLVARSVPKVPVIGLARGETPPPFAAVSTTGEQLTGPAGLRLVAFFSAGCSACPERVPLFAEYVRANGLAPGEVLAVIMNPENEPVPYQARLAEVASVCVDSPDGELAGAFKVVGFPAFCLLDATGTVHASDYDPASLPALTATRH